MTSSQLSLNSTSSTTSFGLSQQTLAFYRQAGSFFNKQFRTLTADSTPLPFTHTTLFQLTPKELLTSQQRLKFSPAALNELLDAFCLNERRALMQHLATSPVMQSKHAIGMSLSDQRELVFEQMRDFALNTGFRFRDLLCTPLRWISHMECLSFHGCNLATKSSVNFGLFGATVLNLGTQQHIDEYADAIASLKISGSFCLTELSHGSNARAIESEATYDPTTQEFILHTPHELAQKIFIGNLSLHANHAIFFAQLTIDGKAKGVHAFVLRIRDDEMKLLPGVRVVDCGPKNGLNGVDNGRLWLDHVRVPRKALLDKFCSVSAEGEYHSPIQSNLKRFTAMISALVFGRIVVAQGANHMAKVGLTIALRYANTRRQFGPENEPEIRLIEFTTHQRRLLPLLAKTFALQFCLNKVKRLAVASSIHTEAGQRLSESQREEINKELHILASGLKPLCTWHRTETLQVCRECCGGQGFLAVNRIGILRQDSDIDLTWEGENFVLLSQVSGALLKEFKRQINGQTQQATVPTAVEQTADANHIASQHKDKSSDSSATAADNTQPFNSSKSQSDSKSSSPASTSAPPFDSTARFRGLFEYLTHQWSMEIRDKNPITRRQRNSRHLHDLEFYENAFEYREARLLRSLVSRLRVNRKVSVFQAWNLSLDVVTELAKAHVERQVTNAFIEEIAAVEIKGTPEQKRLLPMLRALCSLYCLSAIQQSMAFYLTNHYFSTLKAKAVWDEINKLCMILSVHAVELCQAFGIPDGLLDAPIAGDWEKEYCYPNVPGQLNDAWRQRIKSKL